MDQDSLHSAHELISMQGEAAAEMRTDRSLDFHLNPWTKKSHLPFSTSSVAKHHLSS